MTGYSMRSVRFEMPGRFRHINNSEENGIYIFVLIWDAFLWNQAARSCFFSMKSHPDIARFGLIFTDIASEYLARDPSEISQVRAGQSFGKMSCGFVDVEPGTCNLPVQRSRGSKPYLTLQECQISGLPFGSVFGRWVEQWGSNFRPLLEDSGRIFCWENLEIWVLREHPGLFSCECTSFSKASLFFVFFFWKFQFDEIVKTTFVVEEVRSPYLIHKLELVS